MLAQCDHHCKIHYSHRMSNQRRCMHSSNKVYPHFHSQDSSLHCHLDCLDCMNCRLDCSPDCSRLRLDCSPGRRFHLDSNCLHPDCSPDRHFHLDSSCLHLDCSPDRRFHLDSSCLHLDC